MFKNSSIMLQVLNEIETKKTSNWSNIFASLGQLLYVLFIILLVLVVFYFLIKGTSTIRFSKMRKKNLQVIESIGISFQCSIQLIKVSEKYILIGLSKDKITFLTEFSKDEIKIEDEVKTEDNEKLFFADYLLKYSSQIIKKTKGTKD